MAATSVNNDDQVAMDPSHGFLTDAKLFSIAADEDETDFDETTLIERTEIETSVKVQEIQAPLRQVSAFSKTPSSVSSTVLRSNSYRYIQLERALATTTLLKKLEDRLAFENDYLTSLQENTFEEFLQNYYRKIYDYNELIKKTEDAKKQRIFTFIDLEKNFLALDPTRDIKIIFLDDPTQSIISKTTNSQSSLSLRQKSAQPIKSNDAAVEIFYANRSQRFLHDPSQAREEITLFARRAAERLHSRLPRLSSVPHRVKVVDDRDTSGNPDERTLLNMKHKRALSLINKRRQIFIKMVAQSRKNQVKMEQQWKPNPIALDNAACCRELLERANQIQQVRREEPIRRPQTASVSQRIIMKKLPSSACSEITAASVNTVPTISASSVPFQDCLSIDQIEKNKNVRTILSTRPVTAPTKVNWVNYC